MATTARRAKPPQQDEGSVERGTWEETHQRVTFHCSVALRKAIEEEVERSGRSKSRVISDAVCAALGVDV
jgi:hypothetical protein